MPTHRLGLVNCGRRLGAAALLLALVCAVVMWATTGCGRSDVDRVAAGGDAAQSDDIDPAPGTLEQEVVTVGTEASTSESSQQLDATESSATSADSESAAADGASPDDSSTGPILQWTEFDPGISGTGALFSTGDGRVVIGGQTLSGEPYFIVTSNGSDWSELHLPTEIWPHSLDLTGERWAASGWSYDDAGDADDSARVYISDDEGLSWLEAALQVEPRDLPEYGFATSNVTAVATAGTQVVALVRTHQDLDIGALMSDRGLIPDDVQAVGWSLFGDEIHVWLRPESAGGGSQSDFVRQTPDDAVRFAVDELELSAEQLAILERAGHSEIIRVFSGAGAGLAEVLALDGGRVSGVGNDDGFVVIVETGSDEVTMLTSPDGQHWRTQTLDPSLAQGWLTGAAFEPDGTAWIARSDGTDSHLIRWSDGGADVQGAWLGNFSHLDEFSVGPAGLAVSAVPSRRELPTGGGNEWGLPIGRVAKDGYELRYGEPEGGVSLWDLAADEAVYEFGPETPESTEPPAGVREVDDGDTFTLTFSDPATGEELVTFTLEDLEAVFGDQLDSSGSPFDDMWVGWSADGMDWGWQAVPDAFELGDADAQAIVAVGEDFVIASVWVFAPMESRASEAGSANGVDTLVESEVSGEPRWFIARIP